MRKNLKAFSLVLIVTLIFATMVGCQSKTETPDDSSDTGPIKVAVIAPFSGNYTQYGEGYKAAMQMKLDEYNDAGGYNGRKVVADFFDDKCDPKEAVTVTQKIINNDDYVITLGPWSSSVGLAIGPMFGKAEMGLYGISTSHLDFVKQNDYMIRQTPIITLFQEGDARLTYEEYGAKTAAFIHYIDDTATSSVKIFTDAFEKLGGEMLVTETFTTGDVDFSAQLTNIIRANPDAIKTFGSYADTAKIIQQARNLDYKGQITLSGASYNLGLIELAGELAEGSFNIVHIDPDQPQAKELFKKYNEYSGKDMDAHSYMAHDAIWHVLQGIDEVGPDREALVKFLRNNKNAEGTFGKVEYTDGEPNARVFPVIIKDGKFQTYPLEKITLDELIAPIN